MPSPERGFIEKRAYDVRNVGAFAAFFVAFANLGAAVLIAGVAGLSHVIAHHEQTKRTG